MGKRKDSEREEKFEEDIVDVDFDFFDLKEDDFLSIKSLLRQMIGADSNLFNLSSLAQLTIDAPVGTAIKTNDEEFDDVLAILAITEVDFTESTETGKLVQYWIKRTEQNPDLNRALRKIAHNKNSTGLIISERFINMPFDVVVPLYTLMIQECKARNINFEYILVPSRVYTEIASELNANPSQPKRGTSQEYHLFHHEDECIDQVAVAAGNFKYETPVDETDSRRAFQENGILPHGHLAIIKASQLETLLAKLSALS